MKRCEVSCQTLKTIAAITRRAFIPFTSEYGFIPRFSCACAVCSYVLDKVFRNFNINSQMVFGYFDDNDHCFVVIDNEIVVDITATQFGKYSEVIVDDYFHAKSLYKIKISNTNDTLDFVNNDRNWDHGQSPVFFSDELEDIILDVTKQVQACHIASSQ